MTTIQRALAPSQYPDVTSRQEPSNNSAPPRTADVAAYEAFLEVDGQSFVQGSFFLSSRFWSRDASACSPSKNMSRELTPLRPRDKDQTTVIFVFGGVNRTRSARALSSVRAGSINIAVGPYVSLHRVTLTPILCVIPRPRSDRVAFVDTYVLS